LAFCGAALKREKGRAKSKAGDKKGGIAACRSLSRVLITLTLLVPDSPSKEEKLESVDGGSRNAEKVFGSPGRRGKDRLWERKSRGTSGFCW